MSTVRAKDYRRSLIVSKFRIKVKSLALEAREISLEANRYKVCRGPEVVTDNNARVIADLTYHRKEVLRFESRAAQWAYAIYRGKSYQTIERSAAFNTDLRLVMAKTTVRILKSIAGVELYTHDVLNWVSGLTETIKLQRT